jgi:hypothetical protein
MSTELMLPLNATQQQSTAGPLSVGADTDLSHAPAVQ